MQTIDIITDGPVSGFTKGIINAQIPPEFTNIMDTTPVEVEITPWQSNAHHRHMVGGNENSYLIITHPPSLGGLNMDTVFRYAYKRFITGAKVASSTADCIGVLLLAQQELSINMCTRK